MKSAAAEHLPSPVRIVVVDDEPLFVEMLSVLLEREEGIEIVGTAGNGEEALGLVARLRPDVVVMDLSMPVMNGIDATRAIRERDGNACVLILTGGSSIVEIDDARKAGAAGYITKDRIANELVAEIRNLAAR